MYGVICHEHIGPAREWTQWDELLGSSVADMLALVLTMSERVAAERALEAHQDRLEALVEQRTSELRSTEAGMRSLFEGAPVAVLVSVRPTVACCSQIGARPTCSKSHATARPG